MYVLSIVRKSYFHQLENIFQPVTQHVVRRFNDAGFNYDTRTVHNLVLGALVVSSLVGALFSFAFALCAPAISMTVLWVVLGRRIKSRDVHGQKVNDEICYMIGRFLRAGYSLESAIGASCDQFSQSHLLNKILQLHNSGATLDGAIEQINARHESISMPEKMMCATIVLAQSMGGDVAKIFDRIGDNFHQSYELIDDTFSALAQVRMSAYVIVSLPLLMFIFSIFLGSDSSTFLFTHQFGWMCLILGIGLEILGALWMQKLVANGVGIWVS